MTLVLGLLLLALVVSAVAWWAPAVTRVQLALAGGSLACLAMAGLLVVFRMETWTTQLVITAGALAVVGGGPVSVAVFRLVDGSRPSTDSIEGAGDVLRGGAWIGCLERLAVFATLLAGWPEGLAVVLAVKGLARYPELRGPESGRSVMPHGVAERFIIGTFVSVLWAVACAGLVIGPR